MTYRDLIQIIISLFAGVLITVMLLSLIEAKNDKSNKSANIVKLRTINVLKAITTNGREHDSSPQLWFEKNWLSWKVKSCESGCTVLTDSGYVVIFDCVLEKLPPSKAAKHDTLLY